MRIAIIYATNSGSTYLVSKKIESLLKKKHRVSVIEAKNASVVDMNDAELVIFGSPSWDYDGREGYPHRAMLAFMEKMQPYHFVGKQCAVFGCGDTSYTNFCGAVDHLEHFIQEKNAKLIAPSLRIDGYYFDEKNNLASVEKWVKMLS